MYYVPPEDVHREFLRPSRWHTFCEFKGKAGYCDLVVDGHTVSEAAWYYADPSPGYETIRDHLAFFPGRVDECCVDEERVEAQEGDFYGGWIAAELVGPFKSGRDTTGW